MEKKTYSAHRRITENGLARWKDWPNSIRLIAILMVFFLCFWIMINVLVFGYGDIKHAREALFMLPINLFIMPALIFAFYSLTYYPKKFGKITLGNSITFSDGIISDTYKNGLVWNWPWKARSYKYKHIDYIYIDRCSRKLRIGAAMRYSYRQPEYYDIGQENPVDDYYASIYGEQYVVGRNKEWGEIIAFSYNEEAYQLLKERCPDAIVFENRDEYFKYRNAKKAEADKIEKELTEKSGVQDFDGYVN